MSRSYTLPILQNNVNCVAQSINMKWGRLFPRKSKQQKGMKTIRILFPTNKQSYLKLEVSLL